MAGEGSAAGERTFPPGSMRTLVPGLGEDGVAKAGRLLLLLYGNPGKSYEAQVIGDIGTRSQAG